MNDLTLRQARDLYFETNGFGPNGGYDDPWVDFSLGPVPFPFPNTPARVRAVRFHDLHHVLTGYATSTVGEFEIAAWELAAGCKGFAAAWALNLGGLLFGLLVAPRRTVAAFFRGRGDRTVYGEAYEALLDLRVGDARARYLAAGPRAAGLRDAALLALAAAGGVAVSLLLLALIVPLVPVGLATNALRRRRLRREVSQARAMATRQGGA